MALQTESLYGAAYEVTAMSVKVSESGLPSPSTLIRSSETWNVQVDWDVQGVLIGFMHGYWHIRFMMEALGPGADFELPAAGYTMPLVIGQTHYTFISPNFGPNNPPVPAPNDPRIYQLTTVITLADVGDNPEPLSAFIDGPTIQFYRAP